MLTYIQFPLRNSIFFSSEITELSTPTCVVITTVRFSDEVLLSLTLLALNLYPIKHASTY